MKALEVTNISKRYPSAVQALSNITFSVNEGEIFGLIGPDGAGKTTLLRILTTLLLADEGSACVCGYDTTADYKQIRRIIGYMPGQFSLYQDLTVEENLQFFATLFNTTIEANYDIIRDIYTLLAPFSNRPAGKLSGGMKQKLALCCALIHRPQILILDEPTTGVDPVSRIEFWDMLHKLSGEGITIIVSTPYMDEAQRCDRIMLMREGTILATDTPQSIRSAFPNKLYSVKGRNIYPLLLKIRSWRGTLSCYSFGDSLHLTTLPNSNITELEIQLSDYPDITIEEIEPTIEDCFMTLTQ